MCFLLSLSLSLSLSFFLSGFAEHSQVIPPCFSLDLSLSSFLSTLFPSLSLSFCPAFLLRLKRLLSSMHPCHAGKFSMFSLSVLLAHTLSPSVSDFLLKILSPVRFASVCLLLLLQAFLELLFAHEITQLERQEKFNREVHVGSTQEGKECHDVVFLSLFIQTQDPPISGRLQITNKTVTLPAESETQAEGATGGGKVHTHTTFCKFIFYIRSKGELLSTRDQKSKICSPLRKGDEDVVDVFGSNHVEGFCVVTQIPSLQPLLTCTSPWPCVYMSLRVCQLAVQSPPCK